MRHLTSAARLPAGASVTCPAGRALGLTATSGFPASSDPGPRAAGRPGRQHGGTAWAVALAAGASVGVRLGVSGGSLRLFPRSRGESWLRRRPRPRARGLESEEQPAGGPGLGPQLQVECKRSAAL